MYEMYVVYAVIVTNPPFSRHTPAATVTALTGQTNSLARRTSGAEWKVPNVLCDIPVVVQGTYSQRMLIAGRPQYRAHQSCLSDKLHTGCLTSCRMTTKLFPDWKSDVHGPSTSRVHSLTYDRSEPLTRLFCCGDIDPFDYLLSSSEITNLTGSSVSDVSVVVSGSSPPAGLIRKHLSH